MGTVEPDTQNGHRAGSPFPAVTVSPLTRRFSYRFVKRAIDLVAACAGLTVLSPLFLLLAIAVRLSSTGPIVYRWNVIGIGGHPFRGYKFRTMVPDADQLKPTLMHLNEMIGPVFKMERDPRMTSLGRVLRRYSLDELPQLWSVLKGDMSLVGPRPSAPHEWLAFEEWQRRKLSVKPGITCLWQVSGRNRIADFSEWTKLDIEYIERWSLGLDLRILLRTLGVVARGTGR